MKHCDLIKNIEELGGIFIRHGSRHDWYQNPTTKIAQPVPRHREIKEHLARYILKMLGGRQAMSAASSIAEEP